MALIIASKWLLFNTQGLLFYSMGYLGLIVGSIIFGSKTHEVYLWF